MAFEEANEVVVAALRELLCASASWSSSGRARYSPWSRPLAVGYLCIVTVVTVFRSRLRPGVESAYQPLAVEMSRMVESMDGFIDQKSYAAADGERVTVVRFADRESQRRWAEDPDHVAAQLRGREEFYSWYDISVSEESYSRHFDNASLP